MTMMTSSSRVVLPRTTTTLRDERRSPLNPPSIGTRRDELLRFPAAITSASDAELDLVLGRVDESIAPGTLDALLERAAAALRRARSEVAGSIPSQGDDDAWTAAINAATLATRALRRCSRDTLRFLCRRRRPIANDDDDDDDETDESGGVAPRDPAVFGFMAAVVDVVAGGADERAPRGRHVDAPKEYALRVACCRALETIADDESSNGAEYSNATEYYSDSKYSDPSSSPSTAAPFANETDGGFDAFDVLMDAVDGAPEPERTYRDVVGETLRLWCRRPAPPPGSNAWMHDPNGASGNPRGGFFGAMAALLLGDDDEDDDDDGDGDDDDWNASVFSPLGDAAGAALTRLMHRPARYDGVAEAGRGVADESARAAVVSTSGTVVRRETDEVPGSNPASAGGAGKSREKWGGGLGEVETVMRRASMDVDDDPGSPLGSSSRRGVEAGVGSPFAPGIDSRADRSGGLVSAENSPGPPPPATGSSVAANPFRDALFRLVRLGSNDSNGDDDDSGDADALRACVVRACVRAMHSDDTAGASVGVFFAYALLYGNEGFYRAVVADVDAVRALVSALLRRAACGAGAEVGGSNPASAGETFVGVASVATATLAMLSQDPAVNRAVHSSRGGNPALASNDSRNDSRNDGTDWFNSSVAAAKALSGSKTIGRRPAPQTLGSAWVLVLCRVARAQSSGEGSGEGGIEPGTSSFARACASAALANSAPYFDGLTSTAAQRLVAVFDVLHRRRRKRVSAAAMGPAGIEPGSERRGRTGSTAAVVGDCAALVSAAMASALEESSRSCPELVYASLQRRDEVFAPFLEEFLESKDSNRDEKDSNREVFHATNDDPEREPAIHRMWEHAAAIDRSLEYFNARVDAAREVSTNHKPGAHWTMDKAMDVIRAACEEEYSKEDSNRGFRYVGETFVYREEIDAHEFFRPIVNHALSGRRR